MSRTDIAQGTYHAALQMSVLLVQLGKQPLHPLAFLVNLAHDRTATVNGREIILTSQFYYIGFFHVDQWPDHRVSSVVGQELGAHGG